DKYINIVNLTNLDNTQKSLLSDHHPLSAVILRK
ncbi:endonuclease/exonuclease/phosphatase family protein, partial [Acinetobacter baumannii]